MSKEKKNKYAREWREKNKERLNKENKERYQNDIEYKETDIQTEWLEELQASRTVCPYCNIQPIEWHLDHMTPLSRNGTHTKDNVQYCCADCNLHKSNKTLKEFLITI